MAFRFTVLALSLALSNFLFQAVTAAQWGHASELSFFQAVALACAYFLCVRPSIARQQPART